MVTYLAAQRAQRATLININAARLNCHDSKYDCMARILSVCRFSLFATRLVFVPTALSYRARLEIKFIG